MGKAGLLAGGAFIKCEPSAAGRIWKRGAAEWGAMSFLIKKARRKRYVACDELVRLTGLEPVRPEDTSTSSLPVYQFQHSRILMVLERTA